MGGERGAQGERFEPEPLTPELLLCFSDGSLCCQATNTAAGLRRGFPGVHNEDQNSVLFPGNFNVLGERKEMNIFKIVHCR